jgi:subtilisin-like proprotein convertase family protein
MLIKKSLKIIGLVLYSGLTFGQTFSVSNPQQIPTFPNNLIIPIEVNVPSTIIDHNFGLSTVCLTINHPRNPDLSVKLISPDGTSSTLFYDIGSSSTGFFNTCLSDIGTPIYNGSDPYTGNYKAMLPLGQHNNGQNPNGTWKLLILDSEQGENGDFVSASLEFSNAPAFPFSVENSNLPIIKIKTLNEPIKDYYKVKVGFSVIDHQNTLNSVDDSVFTYNGYALTEWQGWSSSNSPKKNYDLDLVDVNGTKISSPLLGMPEENDWILKAEYSDRTSIKNALVFDLAQEMPKYAPRTRFCEVILDDEYIGLYSLTEKIKKDKNRVNIDDLAPNDPTGGYLFEMNPTGATPSWYSVFPPINDATTDFEVEFKIIEPKPSDSDYLAYKNYLKNYIDTFESVLNSPNYQSTLNGYRNYINVYSFIDFMLLNEFSANYDSYGRSTYLFKESNNDGGKLHIGPPWDYDRTFGYDFPSTSGWVWEITNYYWPFPFWWSKLWSDPNYRKEVACRWKSYRASTLSSQKITEKIDSLVNNIAMAKTRNDYIWPDDNAVGFQQHLSNLNQFISQRLNWIDSVLMIDTIQIPSLNLISDTMLCLGDSLNFSQFTNFSCNWTPGPDTLIFYPQKTGIYKFTITDNNGCFTSADLSIGVSNPSAQFTVNPLSGNDFIECVPQQQTYYSYSWDFGDGSSSNELSTLHQYAENGYYLIHLSVADSLNCSGSMDTLIWVNTTTIENSLVEIYPNPFTDEIIVVTDSSIWGTKFTLFDLAGNKILSFSPIEYNHVINTTSIRNGMYFICDERKRIYLKITKI